MNRKCIVVMQRDNTYGHIRMNYKYYNIIRNHSNTNINGRTI